MAADSPAAPIEELESIRRDCRTKLCADCGLLLEHHPIDDKCPGVEAPARGLRPEECRHAWILRAPDGNHLACAFCKAEWVFAANAFVRRRT
jgi:hypothetical protein